LRHFQALFRAHVEEELTRRHEGYQEERELEKKIGEITEGTGGGTEQGWYGTGSGSDLPLVGMLFGIAGAPPAGKTVT
jgi:hypothetical protein